MAETTDPNALLAELKETFQRGTALIAQLENISRDDLTPETQAEAEVVVKLVPEFRQKLGEAKKTLDQLSRTRKRGRSSGKGGGGSSKTSKGKSASTGTGTRAAGNPSGSNKRPRVETAPANGGSSASNEEAEKQIILIGHEKYLEELATLAIEDPMDEKDFLPELFCQHLEDRQPRVTLGLKLAVNGLEGYDPESLGTHMTRTAGDIIVQTIKEHLANTSVKELGAEGLHSIYSSIELPNGVFARETSVKYTQTCATGIQGLRFGAYWRDLETGPRTRKTKEIFGAYAHSSGIQIDLTDLKSPALQALRKTPGFIRYLAGFNNFKQGAVRYFDAYKVLDRFLLVCPLLDFQSFKDPVMGALLNETIPEIKKIFAKDPKRNHDRIQMNRALADDILTHLPAGQELLAALKDLDDSGLLGNMGGNTEA